MFITYSFSSSSAFIWAKQICSVIFPRRSLSMRSATSHVLYHSLDSHSACKYLARYVNNETMVEHNVGLGSSDYLSMTAFMKFDTFVAKN